MWCLVYFGYFRTKVNAFWLFAKFFLPNGKKKQNDVQNIILFNQFWLFRQKRIFSTAKYSQKKSATI